MSKPSKSALSGLKTIQRDFSTTSQASQPFEIDVPSTSPEQKQLSQRLKDIQDALSGKSVSSERVLTNSSLNKRPLSTFQTQEQPTKKPRQLPSSFLDPPQTIGTTSAQATRNKAQPAVTTNTTNTVKTVVSKSASKKVAAVFLSQEQTQILKLVQEGHSVFYTGSAGTGKSVLLREIIKTLRKQHVKSLDAVAVTASTGIAACNIGGVTIHSFAGIGLGIETAQELTVKIRKNKKASARWLRTKVLIIDEVSMMDGDLFDKLATIGSILRKKPEPFGGIQVIVTGDFFQLPPVTKGNVQVKFAFEAQLWNETIKRTFNLTKVFRQRDQEFVDMLNEMRFGRLSSKSIAKFRSLSRAIVYEDGLGATELFPRREDVDRSNSTRIKHLSTEDRTYKAIDTGAITDPQQRERLLANFMAPSTLYLRVDSQVMLLKNMDDTLVNGSMGKVVRFADPAVYGTGSDGDGGSEEIIGILADKKVKSAVVGGGTSYPIVEFATPGGYKRTVMVSPEVFKVELPNGEVQVSRTQFPLILSWAMSIHKSQGQTLERVKVDLGKVFEKGQAYVALSRATSLEGLQVLNFDPNKVKAHPKVVEWSKTLETVDE